MYHSRTPSLAGIRCAYVSTDRLTRSAVNPPNAVLNCLYAMLEAEARLAAAELGLDPGLGVLHRDTPNRDSLACDLMEPVRPLVDVSVFH